MQPTWKALAAHHDTMRTVHLRRLFAEDATRGHRLTAEAAGLYLDYSKNRITDETLRLLRALAEESGLRGRSGGRPSSSTARTSWSRCTPCSTAWRRSRIACAAARGAGTPGGAFVMSSTTGSVAPTSGPSWRTRRSRRTAIAR